MSAETEEEAVAQLRRQNEEREEELRRIPLQQIASAGCFRT
jgi:hypothetical protein